MRSMTRFWTVVVAACVLFGCAANPPGPYLRTSVSESSRREILESLSLEQWRSVEIPGFVIYSPLPDAELQRIIVRIETFVELVDRFVFGERPPPPGEPYEIIIFGTKEQFEHFAPEFAAGYFTHSDVGVSMVVDGSERLLNARNVMQHELVHVVLHRRLGDHIPRWFNEGLAELFASVSIQGDLATLGSLPQLRLETMRKTDPPRLRRLLSSEGRFGFYEYAYAWTFIHYGLFSEHLGGKRRVESFWQFVALTSEGQSWHKAFHQAFDSSYATIEGEWWRYRDWLFDGELVPKMNIEIAPTSRTLAFAPVARDEVVPLLARLGSMGWQEKKTVATVLYDEISKTAPDDIEALSYQVRSAIADRDFPLAASTARRLESLPASDDARVQASRLSAGALLRVTRFGRIGKHDQRDKGPALLNEARSMYREATSLMPDWVHLWVLLGHAYDLDPTADPKAGVEVLQHARSLGRGMGPDGNLALVRLYLREGDRKAAREVLVTLIDTYRATPPAREAELLMGKHNLW